MARSLSSIEARRYSADELLHLRTSLPVVNCIVNKLNKHPDIACLVRIPEQALRDPDGFSIESRSFADVMHGRRGQQMSKGHTIESSEESEYQTIADRKTNRSPGEVQWNFRGRDASDRSSQPHSAPTGIAAQQSENFQRFYRAVVSPTHVRVTAGGRIVPNTRAPPPFEWNGDKFHFEPRKSEVELDQHLQPNSWLQSVPPTLGFPPLIPGGFLPPYNILSRGNPIAMTTMTSPIQPGPLVNSNQLPPFIGDTAASGLSQTGTLSQQVKISPPNQFDQTKPFMYNGHLVYPVTPGFQPPPSALPVPISVLGNPSFLPQTPMPPPPAGFYLPQFPAPLASMANQFMFPAGQQLPMGMQNTMQNVENAPSLAPYLPMVPPMVPISDLIKSHIQILQSNLKQIEEQLASNKHQVDETFMEHQRGSLLSQISNMQALLESQIAQEGGSKIGLRGDESQAGLGISTTSSQENTVSSLTAKNSVTESSNEASLSTGEQKDSAKPTVKAEPTQVELNNGEKKSAVRIESTTKSRLTMAAAMAPPFQPRAQTAIAQASQTQLANEIPRSAVTSPIENAPFETQAQIESRLLARSSTDWGYSGFPNIAATANVTLSRTQSVQESSTQRQHNGQPPILQKFNTFPGQTNTVPVSPPIISPNAVPYLVGTLPQGIHASQAKSTDLVYSRPLTDDEIRARYLYWGKAPRSVQSGLPKFDGKDFYPPSPVKQDARLASATPKNSSLGSQNINASVSLLNFENLFDSPAESPDQNLSEQSGQFGRNSVFKQQAHFENSGHDYGAASFRFGDAGLPDSSTNYSRAVGTAHQPQTPPHTMGYRNIALTPITEDFSHLFLERGVPGYKSPSPLRTDTTQSRFNEEPITPKNPGSPDESERGLDTGRVDSSETTKLGSRNTVNESAENDTSSTTSTVEIHLSPRNKRGSPQPAHEISFAERVENFRSVEQQTLFLQNMLKNTTQTQIVGLALSGTISSATAQGYLPQYRGSAAASLAPAMVNLPAGDRDDERSLAKPELTHDSAVSFAPANAANFLPENRPLTRNRLHRPTPPPAESRGAEGYMRYLSQKNEIDKKGPEKKWNTDEPGTGPVSGPDW